MLNPADRLTKLIQTQGIGRVKHRFGFGLHQFLGNHGNGVIGQDVAV
ncbi:Uncharacterised protein [Vibrio cholerae]|nr:Uncharacterised protein [Vibrio cholerae]CSI88096.1 Uncharacterised protein [Vibrio cholerae]